MMSLRFLAAISFVLYALAASPDARADVPQDLSDLVGARGSPGETQMQARGYRLVRSAQVRDQSWTFWWSDVQRQCVSVSTTDGRYASIQRVPESNCQAGPAGSAGPVGAGGMAGGMVGSDSRPPMRPDGGRPDAGRSDEGRSDVLTLVCYGEGSRLTYAPHYGYNWNSASQRYEPTNGIESSNEQFSSGVQVEIRDGQGRIHLADKLLPLLHSHGDRGWWALDDVRVTRSHITGRYRLNALNRHTIDIDRHTGMIEIKGSPGFTGRCDIGNWGAERRF